MFNTVLNKPILLTNEAFDFFVNNESIDDSLLKDDEKEAVFELISSFLYVKEDFDEYEVCREKNNEYLSRFADGLTFEFLDLRVSEACNFGCRHCIAKESNKKRIMNSKDALKYIDEFVKFKRRDPEFNQLNIHFGNCEPLLNFDVVKDCIDYVEETYKDLIIKYSINTNLSLLNESMALYLIEHKVEIYTSLDGPKEGNDRIRINKNGLGTYSLIVEKMNMLEKLSCPIGGISITVTDANFEFLDNHFWDWCVSKGFVSIACDFDLVNSLNISNDEKVRFLVNAWRFFVLKGIEFYGTWMTPFINLSNNSCSESTFSFCKAGRGLNISVDADGNIGACSYSSHKFATFQDLSKSIRPGGKYYELVSGCLVGQAAYAECVGCILEGSCCGQCQMTRHSSNHKMVENQCDFYKRVTAAMLQAQAELLINEERREDHEGN